MSFKKFKLDSIHVPDDVLCIYGPKKVRATCVDQIINGFNLAKGHVYVKNPDDKEFYNKFLPDTYVSDDITQKGIAYLLKKDIKNKFIIFDSCFDNPDDTKFIQSVCKKAKKYNTLVIVSINKGETLPPDLNDIATCVIISETKHKSDRNDLFETFGKTLFDTYRSFTKCFGYLTEDRNLMVICKNDSKDLHKQAFWLSLEEPLKSKSKPKHLTEEQSALSEPESKEPASKEPESKEPASKEPASKEPESKVKREVKREVESKKEESKVKSEQELPPSEQESNSDSEYEERDLLGTLMSYFS